MREPKSREDDERSLLCGRIFPERFSVGTLPYCYLCYLDWFGGISSERIIVIIENSNQRPKRRKSVKEHHHHLSRVFCSSIPTWERGFSFLVSDSESAPSFPFCLDGYVLAAAPCHSPVVFARLMPESRLAASASLHARPALGAASRARTEGCQGLEKKGTGVRMSVEERESEKGPRSNGAGMCAETWDMPMQSCELLHSCRVTAAWCYVLLNQTAVTSEG